MQRCTTFTCVDIADRSETVESLSVLGHSSICSHQPCNSIWACPLKCWLFLTAQCQLQWFLFRYLDFDHVRFYFLRRRTKILSSLLSFCSFGGIGGSRQNRNPTGLFLRVEFGIKSPADDLGIFLFFLFEESIDLSEFGTVLRLLPCKQRSCLTFCWRVAIRIWTLYVFGEREMEECHWFELRTVQRYRWDYWTCSSIHSSSEAVSFVWPNRWQVADRWFKI